MPSAAPRRRHQCAVCTAPATAGKPARPFQPCFLMLPTLSLPVLVHTLPALAFKAAKPDMAQKIVSGLHFRSRSLYGPGLGVEYCWL